MICGIAVPFWSYNSGTRKARMFRPNYRIWPPIWGMSAPSAPHHYLKLTPELRQAASRRFHEHFAQLFAKGGLA